MGLPMGMEHPIEAALLSARIGTICPGGKAANSGWLHVSRIR
jgi:hypothetical protein